MLDPKEKRRQKKGQNGLEPVKMYKVMKSVPKSVNVIRYAPRKSGGLKLMKSGFNIWYVQYEKLLIGWS